MVMIDQRLPGGVGQRFGATHFQGVLVQVVGDLVAGRLSHGARDWCEGGRGAVEWPGDGAQCPL